MLVRPSRSLVKSVRPDPASRLHHSASAWRSGLRPPYDSSPHASSVKSLRETAAVLGSSRTLHSSSPKMAVNGSGTQLLEDVTASLKRFGIDSLPTFPNAYPELNPVDIYRAHLTEIIAPLSGAAPEIVYQAIQWTQTLEKGDLCLPLPALRLKGKKPDELAKSILERFPESPLVETPKASGTFLEFYFKPQPLFDIVLPSILKAGPKYGFNTNLGLRDATDPTKGQKRIIIEFSSPNIAKPFHAGHLRSTIIGGFLAHMYEGAGWDVVKINYLGDWGKQYGVLALGFERFGSEEALAQNPIGHLYDVYVKISAMQREQDGAIKAKQEQVKELLGKGEEASQLQAEVEKLQGESIDEQARRYFKRMAAGDSEAVGVWRRFRGLSIEKYKQTYGRLNIAFDDYSGESQVAEESMDRASRVMEEQKVSELSEGAVIVDLTKHAKKLGKAIVRKRDGTSIYLTRDIGAITEREARYGFDRMIYVVAVQQDLHFAQLFKIVELMGMKELAGKCEHVNFGLVKGMSTRKGTAKFLDDILQDVSEKMHEVMKTNAGKYEQVEEPEKTADTLGISAVMVQDMSAKRRNDYEFDMNRMTSFEGDTGPYLQYAHARLCSIFRKAGLAPGALGDADYSLLTSSNARDVVRALAQWPDVFQQTMKTREPITVLTYLFKMTHMVSSAYHTDQVVGSEEGVKKARLAMYNCARQVLNNGMRLLGLSPVERM